MQEQDDDRGQIIRSLEGSSLSESQVCHPVLLVVVFVLFDSFVF